MNKPIPIIIITGFLGAGKTTLLNHILHTDHKQKVAVVVNDFGAINIDAQLVSHVDNDALITLSNGCICCTIREDLVQETLALIATQKPDHIIIETSGVSDPIDVTLAFKAIEQVKIESVITVIDAENILTTEKQLQDLVWNQIGTADLIMLNKIDLVTSAQRTAVHQYVTRISPKARIIETQYASVPIDLVLDASPMATHPVNQEHILEAHHDHQHAQIFDTWHWQSDSPIYLKPLEHVLKALPTAIYRVKGILYTVEAPEGLILQMVGKRISIRPASLPMQAQSQIVLIGAYGQVNPHALEASFQRACQPPATNAINRIGQVIKRWLKVN